MNRRSKVIRAYGSHTDCQMRTRPTFHVILLLTFVALLRLAAFESVYAQTSYEPLPPNTFLNTAYPSNMSGQTFTPATSTDFQNALNSAQLGDTIVLKAGVTYAGSFILPAKTTGAGWIIIRTSNMAGISAEGARIDPTTPSQLAAMPILQTPPNTASPGPIIDTATGAHHYRLVGVNITTDPSASTLSSGLVRLGNAENSTTSQPSFITVDRCYIHTRDNSSADVKRGVLLNANSSAVIDSYISNIHANSVESQGILGWNAAGPFKIVNNYVEAAGENIMFGGSSPMISGLIPSDIEIRRNHLYKPPAWKHVWLTKNLLEFKNGQRALIEGNLLENNWYSADFNPAGEQGQKGYAVLLKSSSPDTNASWTVVKDINFKNNTVRHTGSAVNIAGTENGCLCQQANRIAVRNNLFDDVNSVNWGGDASISEDPKGTFLKITAANGITVDHNTVFQDGEIINTSGAATTNFTFTNNIAPHNQYGIKGDSHSTGTDTINTYLPGAAVHHNVMPTTGSFTYPTPNYFPATLDDVGFVDRLNGNYRLRTDSTYHNFGSDGTDIGANIDAIDAAMAGTSPPSGLPSPWANQDVGSVGVAGSTTYSSGTFTVKGSGADIWDINDGFQFIYQPLSGNGQIVARVLSLQNTNVNAKAGLMIRETLAADSTHVILDYTPNGSFEFMRRSTTGGTTTYIAGATATAPYWAKLVRSGSTVTGYTSSDGTNWTQTGSATVSMASNVYIGMVACSHDNTTLTTATFDNVSVSALANNPPTISLTSPANGATFSAPATITVSANASDSDGSISKVDFYAGTTPIGTATTSPYSITWSNVGANNYVLKAIATDNSGATTTSATVNVTVNAAQAPYGGTAIAVPATIEAENFDTGGEGVAYHDLAAGNAGSQYRTTEDVDIQAMTGASNGYAVFNAYAGEWLEYTINVTTAGTYNIEAMVAAAGGGGRFHIEVDNVNVTGTVVVPATSTWSNYQSTGRNIISLTAGTHVLRLALDVNGADTVVADFDRVIITSSSWTSQDIGSVGLAGSTSASNGAFTIKGAGADIWGTADSFRYVYQSLSGNGQIVARVTSLTNTNVNAKGGVMIRETPAANSKQVILDYTPGSSIEFMSRSTTGGTTAYLGGSAVTLPIWLKLVRSGDTFTAYKSTDGLTWTPVGSTGVTMATSAYIGMAVTSHTTSQLSTAVLDNIRR